MQNSLRRRGTSRALEFFGFPTDEPNAAWRAAADEVVVTWDGRDDFGSDVAPEIYYYRLEGPDFEATRKALVIR